MDTRPSVKVKLWLSGLTYGVALTTMGVILAGAGHGTYLLLGVASAPMSYLGVAVAILLPPLLWGAVGWLLSQADRSPQRQLVAIILLAHYAGIFFLPGFEEYLEAKYVLKTWEYNPELLIVGLAVYLGGQVVTWYFWLRARPKVL